MPETSIVVPLYNEEENVEPLIHKLKAVMEKTGIPFQVVLVDDGSTDSTWARMQTCVKTCPRFTMVRLRRNYGQTAALSAGFRNAKGDIVVTMDGDLQNDPEDIPRLLDKLNEGYDVVNGWRKDRKEPWFSRRLPSAMASAIINKVSGLKLHDHGCTLRAYRRDIVKNLSLYGEMHRFIPSLASWVGGRICEIPVNHSPRKFGKSKYGISRTLRVMLDLMTLKFLLSYSSHPIQVFGKFGLLFGVAGSIMLGVVLVGHFSFLLFDTRFAADLVKRPFWVITPFMLILFCVQFISMGLLAELQLRTYHESQDKPIYLVKEVVEGSGQEDA
jgi:glycosyltransferase involved in cell wall biosynthesis